MVFLSEASIREMVQEALGGGGYPSLDGDGNFPIIPSPLAEPIVTKLALQPVRVMRVPTDRHEFEFAVRELVDGVEQDHLPTLFLKLRELVNDFSPPMQDSSPCPEDCSPKDDPMTSNVPPKDDMTAMRAEVRKYIRELMSEADAEEDVVAQWRKKYPPRRVGLANTPVPLNAIDKEEEKDPIDWSGDDWEDGDGPSIDVGAAEDDPADEPYPEDYLKDPGYPSIGEDPDPDTWEDLEVGLNKSAWNPAKELDQFRGGSRADDWDKLDAAIQAAQAAPTPDPNKPKEAKGGVKDWDSIAKELGIGVGSAHGAAAIGQRKLAYIGDYLGFEGFDEFYDQTTDKYIEYMIKQGAERGEDGKPLLSMADVMELRSASKFEEDDGGERVSKPLDEEGEQVRKAIQELDGFREFLNVALEHEMTLDGYAVSHKDAAKDKDRFSVMHRMKRTTR